MAIFVDVTKNIVEALDSYDILGTPVGNPLGGLAPVCNPTVQVAYVDTVAQRVGDGLNVQMCQVLHGSPPEKRREERATLGCIVILKLRNGMGY